MIKRMLFVLLSVLFFLPASVIAGGTGECATKYPIVFAHGFAVQEGMLGILDYFYGVEGAVIARGGETFTTTVNSMDSTENKAKLFAKQVREYVEANGLEKVNIIGHSHGGVYPRYAISLLGLDDVVASFTTIDAPHRGSSGPDMVLEMCRAADWVLGSDPKTVETIVGNTITKIYGNFLGDDNPHALENCYAMTTDYMVNEFNPKVVDNPNIYYQSYAGIIKFISPSNSWATVLWPAIGLREGANDGCVSVWSAKWGNYRGRVTGAWWSNGVDHMRIIGHPFGVTPGFDAPAFYVDIVKDLKQRGY